MSKKKNIVVIDDVGDLVQLLGTAFQKYEAIGLTQVSSEVDQLNEILDEEYRKLKPVIRVIDRNLKDMFGEGLY